MTPEVTDVLEAVQSFVAKGYDREYSVKEGNLLDLKTQTVLDPSIIRVDAALRVESGKDGEDAFNIYAITDVAIGQKGLLIDAFDVFDEICKGSLSERLLAERETALAGDQEVPSKHGLRKVFKADFEGDPERYVLREGFPDFPPCPWGGSFSILGFDMAERSYVWLVTSILRDTRLIRILYKGGD